MYTLPCVKQIASGKLLYNPSSSAQCSVMTQKGGVEQGVGGRLKMKGIQLHLQLIHVVVQQKLTQHCKTIIHQKKKKRQRQFSSLLKDPSCLFPVISALSQYKSQVNIFFSSTSYTWKHKLCIVYICFAKLLLLSDWKDLLRKETTLYTQINNFSFEQRII